MKPKQPVGNKVSELGVAPDLNVGAPCACCSLLFVANCAVPFSCGCLFHPWCLWAELLSGRGVCPCCKQVADSTWLESWGCDGLLQQLDLCSGAKGKESIQASTFHVRKREAVENAECEPPVKLTKPRGLNIKGPSPLSGKSGTHVPLLMAHPQPFRPFDFFANRPRGLPRTEAVAVAVTFLAIHSTCLYSF